MKTNIGILGAGQLGQMLAQAGQALGLNFTFFDPSENPCAAAYGSFIQAQWSNSQALKAFALQSEIITFEFENVPSKTIEILETQKSVFPPLTALEIAQDRLKEKKLFTQLNIPTVRYESIETLEHLQKTLLEFDQDCILKRRFGGYDGKAQLSLKADDDLKTALPLLEKPTLLEKRIKFDHEVSQICVRNQSGQLQYYPLSRNRHSEGVLISARAEPEHPLSEKARNYACQIATALNYVGVLTIEFFVRGNELIANEIAPRVHNSGHWTIEGAVCSQFENHLRAILDLPLGATNFLFPCVTYNLLGQIPAERSLLAIDGLHLHVYGKTPRPGRKIGHVTLTALNQEDLNERERLLHAILF